MAISIGSIIWIAVKPILKVYLIIGTGYFLSKRNVLTIETSRNISDIVVTVLIPCLTFYKIVTNVSDDDIKNVGIVCLTSVLLYGLGGLGSFLINLVTPAPRNWVGGLLLAGILPNVQDITVAMLQTMNTGVIFTEEEADRGVTYVILFFMTFTVLLFNLGGFRLVEWDFIKEQRMKDEDMELCRQNVLKEDNNVKRECNISQDHLNESDNREDDDNSSVEITDPVQINDDCSSRRSYYSTGVHSSNRRSRTDEIRRVQSQTIDDVISEYKQDYPTTTLSKILTTEVGVTTKDIIPPPNSIAKKYHLGFIVFFLKNCLRPCSMATIVALTIAFVPWLKALFVHTTVSIPDAPDELPPLSFVMDYTSYVSGAAIPFALLLLGGTIAKIEVTVLPKGFWKTALALTVMRLIILPILGVLWGRALMAMRWIDQDDKVFRFVIVVTFGLPTLTSIIYFTAFHTSVDSKDKVQMNCVSILFLMQYPVLLISLPILVSYVLKVELGF